MYLNLSEKRNMYTQAYLKVQQCIYFFGLNKSFTRVEIQHQTLITELIRLSLTVLR